MAALVPVSPALEGPAEEATKNLNRAKQDQVSSFVVNAAMTGDRDTVNAVLGAPAWLSGLEPDHLARIRSESERAWFPAEVRQVAALDEVLAVLDKGTQDLAATYAEVLGTVEAAKEHATKSPQAAALDKLALEVEALGA